MVLTKSLLWAVMAACSVSALPLLEIDVSGINLAIAAKLNMSGVGTIIAADRARAARLKQAFLPKAKRQNANIDVTNNAVTYLTSVNIGQPATSYSLLIDTGSSNTWVGADKAYTPTQTSQNTGRSVGETYGGGSFSGEECEFDTDRVDLGNGLVINSQSIGVANQSQSFGNGVDGILGVGPTDLTRGTMSGSQDSIPTVTDNLASQGTIGAAVLGMFFAPYVENVQGVLTFGGADSSLYTGQLTYVPITQTYPSSEYWGIDQSVTYGGSTILNSTAGIVDSGTTMIMLATDAFNAYQQATGATEDSATGFLKISNEQYGNLQNLNFNIGSTTVSLTPNGQIWPRSLNTALGGDDDSVYLVIADLGSSSGEGFDFINGYFWMERFYTVFDTAQQRIGFAETQYTNSEDN